MQTTKVKSFTLAEMLVVMIITAIVVGLAFSVLNLVQKQVRGIQENFTKTTELSLLEQRLWQDFNYHNSIDYHNEKLVLLSDSDTVTYAFTNEYILRETDTIRTKLRIENAFYKGREVTSGYIDAIKITADAELPEYIIFVTSVNDATQNMNQDGF